MMPRITDNDRYLGRRILRNVKARKIPVRTIQVFMVFFQMTITFFHRDDSPRLVRDQMTIIFWRF